MLPLKKFAPAVLALSISTIMLEGCPKADDNTPPPAPAPAATAPAPAASAPQSTYVPPTAEQLRQLVAPIAIFPDKLVAQVLAGATYPDQISAAYDWQSQNPGLKGSALQNAVDPEPWDPSVKSLTTFPDVLHQMASNLPWTTALGDAYVNDPTDVMNAIQVLREQAAASGHLKSNAYMNVVTVPSHSDNTMPEPVTSDVSDDPPVYAGPAVVEAPAQVIEIAPSNPDVVYVPTYDPAVIYGDPVVLYPGYAYDWPRPIYYGPYYGGLGFGLGIAIGFGFGHPWGWGAWGIHWGPHFHGYGDRGWGYHGPAVVYNNQTYISHSTTVINHFGNGFRGNGFRGNGFQHMPPGAPAGAAFAHAPVAPGAAGARPAFNPANRAMAAAHMPTPMAAAARPNFNSMSMPRFSHAMATPGFRQSPLAANAHAAGMNTAGITARAGAMNRAAPMGPMHAAALTNTANSSHFNSPSFAAQQRAASRPSFAAASRPLAQAHAAAPPAAPQHMASFNQQPARAPSYRPAENNRPYQPPREPAHAYTPAPRPNYASVNRPSAPAYHPMPSAPRSYSPPSRPSGGGGGGGHAASARAPSNHHAR
ncbi:DUF3300 domain-containing protein [Dyella silvatica]|uniref:DUF3300 domain-containing protein n=1 Tax=Dyella silvatica TaxID=2992128 RepID=UPI002250AFC6|nr:DUF3300 domain-containing protein [Dyella silvatica]